MKKSDYQSIINNHIRETSRKTTLLTNKIINLATRHYNSEKNLLRITGAYKTTSTDALQVILGSIPLDLEILKQGCTYWLKKQNYQEIEHVIGVQVHDKKEIQCRIIDMWQQRWTSSTNGRRTHHLLPNVRESLEIKHLTPSRVLIHFFSGHVPYLNKIYKVEGNKCECGLC